MKHIIGDVAIIGLSVALLWHFSNIWRYGQYLVAEPNILIRSIETVMLLLILCYGVGRFISKLVSKE